jgi:Hsp70 protein
VLAAAAPLDAVKLFQIEEPDGTPLETDGVGAAVGIHLAADAAVAIAVGGNAEILARAAGGEPVATLLALRGDAEKILTRPVTHAVIAAATLDEVARRALGEAAEAAGLTVLRLLTAAEASAGAPSPAHPDSAALGAAILAEDLAPAA